jgi:hypothetical protein
MSAAFVTRMTKNARREHQRMSGATECNQADIIWSIFFNYRALHQITLWREEPSQHLVCMLCSSSMERIYNLIPTWLSNVCACAHLKTVSLIDACDHFTSRLNANYDKWWSIWRATAIRETVLCLIQCILLNAQRRDEKYKDKLSLMM